MPRRLVSESRLVGILTERIQQLSGEKLCSLEYVIRLETPREDGCNWVPGAVKGSCLPALVKVFAKARFEFNIRDD